MVLIEISNLTHSVRTMCSDGVLMDNMLHIQYNVYKTMFTNSCKHAVFLDVRHALSKHDVFLDVRHSKHVVFLDVRHALLARYPI